MAVKIFRADKSFRRWKDHEAELLASIVSKHKKGGVINGEAVIAEVSPLLPSFTRTRIAIKIRNMYPSLKATFKADAQARVARAEQFGSYKANKYPDRDWHQYTKNCFICSAASHGAEYVNGILKKDGKRVTFAELTGRY